METRQPWGDRLLKEKLDLIQDHLKSKYLSSGMQTDIPFLKNSTLQTLFYFFTNIDYNGSPLSASWICPGIDTAKSSIKAPAELGTERAELLRVSSELLVKKWRRKIIKVKDKRLKLKK